VDVPVRRLLVVSLGREESSKAAVVVDPSLSQGLELDDILQPISNILASMRRIGRYKAPAFCVMVDMRSASRTPDEKRDGANHALWLDSVNRMEDSLESLEGATEAVKERDMIEDDVACH